MKWFSNCHNLEEVKAMYKKLAKQFHPDLGGDTVTMQEINREFTFASAKTIKGDGSRNEEEVAEEIKLSEEYRKAIAKVIHLDGIVVEVVGYWIWITGNTYPVRATLKQANFMFATKKMAWYFRTADYKVSKGGKKSLDEIRAKYGSEKLGEEQARGNYLR